MNQKSIGDSGQFFTRLIVVLLYRLFGEVTAGHHQWTGNLFQQQPVKRGIGQHETEPVIARSQPIGKFCGFTFFQQYDGAAGR